MPLRTGMRSQRTSRGFTLIEMMVAITLGLIVLGSLVTFIVSSVNSYTDNTRFTRLTQNLRTGMNIVVREVRRSGYDSASVTRALTSTNPSNYVVVNADEAKNCVTYTYDRGGAASESRGFKLNAVTGTLQMKVAASTVDCTSVSGWEDISDPNVVEITKFMPALVQERFCNNLGDYVDSGGVARKPTGIGTVRTLAVCVKGRLRADNTIERYVVDIARLRADAAAFDMLSTTGCAYSVEDTTPTWAERTLPPTIAQLNDECSKP